METPNDRYETAAPDAYVQLEEDVTFEVLPDEPGHRQRGHGVSACPLAQGRRDRAGHIYWTNARNGTVWQAGLDGSNPQAIITGQYSLLGVAADASHIYWTNGNDGTVWQANVDGSSSHTIVTDQNSPLGVAVGGGQLSLDGTKLAGNAAQKANRMLPQIEKVLAEAAAADAAEDARYGDAAGEPTPRALARRAERRERLARARDRLAAEDTARRGAQRARQDAWDAAAAAGNHHGGRRPGDCRPG